MGVNGDQPPSVPRWWKLTVLWQPDPQDPDETRRAVTAIIDALAATVDTEERAAVAILEPLARLRFIREDP